MCIEHVRTVHVTLSFAALPNSPVAPSIRRRLVAMLYEAVLLFGLVFVTALIFAVSVQQRHALFMRRELGILLFLVMGLYFVWCWHHGGQTLPMKTWRVRLLTTQAKPVSIQRAVLRFLLSWLWVFPSLLIITLLEAKGWWFVLLPAANIAIWAALALLDPARQFVHDRIAGTRLVQVADLPKTPAIT